MEKISVAIRVRPLAKEPDIKGNHWVVEGNTISLRNYYGATLQGSSYAFDHVFETKASNADVYNLHTKDAILSATQGFNSTVFAYGQTSSGKTYTMQGTDEQPGIIRQAVREVFSHISKASHREFLTRVSYLEIYNEEINDLLAPENRKLQIRENVERGVYVSGLREEIVNSPEHVLEFLKLGEAHRHSGETNMNTCSSRSHTIFRIIIESRDRNDQTDAVRVSTLNLVDLAGSERVAKTGAGGVRLREGTHINKSLMTLGNVIKKLSEGSLKGVHVPYRDSKLTRILQSALSGNAKTAIICTVAPEEVHADETKGTLQFASRAKKVATCAHVNEVVTDAALLKRQRREIEELRHKLKGLRSDEFEKELLTLRNDLLKNELEKEQLALQLEEERKMQAEKALRIKEQEQQIVNLNTLVSNSPLQELNSNGKLTPRDYSISPFRSKDSMVLTRRQRDSASPLPSFQTLLQKNSDQFDLARPQNFADQDTWANMNSTWVEEQDQEWLDLNKVDQPETDASDMPGSPGANCSEIELLEMRIADLQSQNEELQKRHTSEREKDAQNFTCRIDDLQAQNAETQTKLDRLQVEIALEKEQREQCEEAHQKDQAALTERLRTSEEHVSALQEQVAALILERDDIARELSVQVERNEALLARNAAGDAKWCRDLLSCQQESISTLCSSIVSELEDAQA